jgi:hypothetical protein
MSTQKPIPGLTGDDAIIASGLFEYVQFLLDDDGNLTPTGNLNAAGRERLRARLKELLEPKVETELPEAEPAPEAGAGSP